ncbi:MAG: VOC family protein [Roseibium sp.]|nr:VOC family protein [Roseibium sp.]
MVRGLDHLVLAVHDLDAAAYGFEALGFTVGPRNQHSWGTANRLIQLDGFFIEILTVAEPDRIPDIHADEFSFGGFNRDFLKRREGPAMLVLESHDPEADRAAFEHLHLKTYAPFSFERTATFKDGSTATVGFDLTFVSDPLAPGIGYFTCRNRYPENFWNSAFQRHENGAKTVVNVVLVADDPSDHHAFLGGFSGQREMRATSLGLELKTPRGTIVVLTPTAFSQLYGVQNAQRLPDDLPAIAALTIGCSGLGQTQVLPAADFFGMTLILTPL